MRWQLVLLSAGLLLSHSPLQAACIAPIHFHLISAGPWRATASSGRAGPATAIIAGPHRDFRRLCSKIVYNMTVE